MLSATFPKRAVIRRPMAKQVLRNSAPSQTSSRSSTKKSDEHDGAVRASIARSKAPPPPITPNTQSLRNDCYMDDEELNSLRERLYEDPQFAEVDDVALQRLLAHLREYSSYHGICENYDEAARASDLLEKARIEAQARHDAVPPRVQTSRQPLPDDEFESGWQQRYDEFDSVSDVKRRELEERQQVTLNTFEESWRERMPTRYRKPSNTLLQIKQMERALAISGQYERARAMHDEANRIARQEAEQLQGHLIRDYRIAREQILRRQRAESTKLESDRARLRTVLDAEKKIEADQRVLRDNVVEDRKAEALKPLRERSGVVKPDYGASVEQSIETKRKLRENAIPELFPPNDPAFLEEDEKKAREKRRTQEEYHRKNAARALLEYRVQESPREDKENQQTEQEAQPESREPHDQPAVLEGAMLEVAQGLRERVADDQPIIVDGQDEEPLAPLDEGATMVLRDLGERADNEPE